MAQPWNEKDPCALPEQVYIRQTKTLETRTTISNISPNVADLAAYTGARTNWLGKLLAHASIGFLYQIRIYCQNTDPVNAENLRIGLRSIVPLSNDSLEELEVTTSIPAGFGPAWHVVNIQKTWVKDILLVTIKGRGANTELYIDILGNFDTYESTDVGASWTPLSSRLALEFVYTGRQDDKIGITGIVSTAEIIKPPEVVQQFSGRVGLDIPSNWEIVYRHPSMAIFNILAFNESLYVGTAVGAPAEIYRLNNGIFWEQVWVSPLAETEVRAMGLHRGYITAETQYNVYNTPSGNAGTWVLRATIVAPHSFTSVMKRHKANLIIPYSDLAASHGIIYEDRGGGWTDLGVGTAPCRISFLESIGEKIYAAGRQGGLDSVYRSLTGIDSTWESIFVCPLASEQIEAMGQYRNELYVATRVISTDIARIYRSDTGNLGSFRLIYMSEDFEFPSVLKEVKGYLYYLTSSTSTIKRFDGSEFRDILYTGGFIARPFFVDLEEYRGQLYIATYETLTPSGMIYSIIDYQIVVPKKRLTFRPPASVSVGAAATLIPFVGAGIGENYERGTLIVCPIDGDIWIGSDNTVAVGNGIPVLQNDVMKIHNYIGEVWAIRAGAVNIDTRYSEIY